MGVDAPDVDIHGAVYVTNNGTGNDEIQKMLAGAGLDVSRTCETTSSSYAGSSREATPAVSLKGDIEVIETANYALYQDIPGNTPYTAISAIACTLRDACEILASGSSELKKAMLDDVKESIRLGYPLEVYHSI